MARPVTNTFEYIRIYVYAYGFCDAVTIFEKFVSHMCEPFVFFPHRLFGDSRVFFVPSFRPWTRKRKKGREERLPQMGQVDSSRSFRFVIHTTKIFNRFNPIVSL